MHLHEKRNWAILRETAFAKYPRDSNRRPLKNCRFQILEYLRDCLFSSPFRNRIIRSWSGQCLLLQWPCTSGANRPFHLRMMRRVLFSCQSSSVPTYLTDWLMIHHSDRSTRQCACIWSDNLQVPYKSKLEVIWDQTTFNFFVYNLQLPPGLHGHHSRHGLGGHGDHGGHVGHIADSFQTEYCPTFLLSVCSCVRHRRDISHFSHI